MRTSSRRTLATIGAALLALIVLALGAVTAWARVDPGSGGGYVPVTSGSGTAATSGGTSWVLIVGIIAAAIVVVAALAVLALRTRGRRRPAVSAVSVDAPTPLSTKAAQPAHEDASHDVSKAA